jgi:hypothetical protein
MPARRLFVRQTNDKGTPAHGTPREYESINLTGLDLTDFAGPSVVSLYWFSTCWGATRPRATLARICSAVAVQTNGCGLSLLIFR